MKYTLSILGVTMTLVSMAQNTGKVNYKNMEFNIPIGWGGSENEEGYLIRREGTTFYMLLQAYPIQNVTQLQIELNAQIPLQEGVVLERSSQIEAISEHALGARYALSTYEAEINMYVAGATDNNGQGSIIFAGDEEGISSLTYEQACKALVASIHFKTIEARKGSLSGIEQQYANCRLTYMDSYYSAGYGDTYGSYRQKITIDLCQKGYFNYSDDFEMGGGGDASAFHGSDGHAGEGNWYISNQTAIAILVLEFFNGEKKEFRLKKNREGHTFLNDVRYYVSNANDEPEYRPQCF